MAVFEFGPECRIEAIWHVDVPDGDWMACLYRKTATAPLECTYRFRWYRDAKVWGSDDRRTVQTAHFKEGAPVDQLIADIDMLAATVAQMAGAPVDKREVHGGFDEFVAAVRDARWFHMKSFKVPADGTCPQCGATGFDKPKVGTRANGEPYIGCAFCVQESQ